MREFLQRVREKTRAVGLADATEQTYTSWIKRYILFHKFQTEAEISRSPREDIEAYVNEQKLSASSVTLKIAPSCNTPDIRENFMLIQKSIREES